MSALSVSGFSFFMGHAPGRKISVMRTVSPERKPALGKSTLGLIMYGIGAPVAEWANWRNELLEGESQDIVSTVFRPCHVSAMPRSPVDGTRPERHRTQTRLRGAER